MAQPDKSNSIVIRAADFTRDALAIVEGAKDFASRVSFGSLLPETDSEFIETISRIVTLQNVEILVAESKGEIVGGIGLLYVPYHWNPKRLIADELFWWCRQDAPFRTGRRLIERAMKDIEERNAIPMFSALTTSPEGVKRTYERFGMKPIETKYARF